jgi:acetyl-CoA carboxylase beta subunit
MSCPAIYVALQRHRRADGSEFLLGTGALDMIVDRRELRARVARAVAMLMGQSADAVA